MSPAPPVPLAPLMLRGLRATAVGGLPILVALLSAPIAFGGGSVLPWSPQMVDLDVYRRAGEAVLAGTDPYATPEGALPFLYPPFAALVAVPLALPPAAVVQVAWLAGNVLALLAVLRRLGVTGWVLCLLTTAAVWFVEPVRHTLAYGQLGIILVAVVLLDLVPDQRGERRRRVPLGALVGVGAAVKLTPAVFVPFLLLARRWRAALVTVATFVAAGVVAAVALPWASAGYWGQLLTGETGTQSYHYLTNQAVYGTWLRLVGLGGWQSATGMLLAAAAAGLGLWAGAAQLRSRTPSDGWPAHGAADDRLAAAVCVVGVGGLLASPISWSHHFVWVLPLAVLLSRRVFAEPARVAGWLFVAWVSAAPFMMLPAGDDVELTYLPWQATLASVTPVLGVGFLGVVALTGGRRRASGIRATRPSAETMVVR